MLWFLCSTCQGNAQCWGQGWIISIWQCWISLLLYFSISFKTPSEPLAWHPQSDISGSIGLYAALGLIAGALLIILSCYCFTGSTNRRANFRAVISQNPEDLWGCFSCTSRQTSDLFTSQTVFMYWDKQTGLKTDRTNIWVETKRILWILLNWFYKYNHRTRKKWLRGCCRKISSSLNF